MGFTPGCAQDGSQALTASIEPVNDVYTVGQPVEVNVLIINHSTEAQKEWQR